MRTTKRGSILLCSFLGVALASPTSGRLVPDYPPSSLLLTLQADSDATHQVGQQGSRGWELDHKRDRPGYALHHLTDPLLLEPGLYRATFYLRRGTYPKRGLFLKTYGLFRLEIWDVTQNQRITWRTLQISDFSKPNRYEKRWLEFSLHGREGHAIEPRVYWMGLANGEIAKIDISQHATGSTPALLEEKAFRMGQNLDQNHLKNGFVVSRKQDGTADELGDATTYTGFYVASLAWKYGVTQDPFAYQALENGIQTLHRAIKGTDDHPLLTRFVNESGQPFPKSPSKDVYTSFFLAYSVAYPLIKNPVLKKQMENDLQKLGNRFLEDGLTVKNGSEVVMSLTPYFTEAEIRKGIRKLLDPKKDKRKKILKTLKTAKRLLPFTELWPGMKKTIRALQKEDEDSLFQLVVPTLNGALDLAQRLRDLLREQYRTDLFLNRSTNAAHSGKKLEQLITACLKKLPKKFERNSDLSVLASNALISLHVVKSAQKVTEQPQFDEYYKTNLYTQDALLKCALDWYNLEEDFTILTSGNPAADRLRKGYLSLLSLYNLIRLETNPSVRSRYQTVLKRWWRSNQNEDNPLAHAIVAVALEEENIAGHADFITRALSLYPENREGLGPDFWKEKGPSVGERLGGGVKKKHAREPLPVSHRPKDSFLWQRNARRLKGDYLKQYPGTDYVFLYWFARYHGLIEDPKPIPRVQLPE